MRIKKSRVRNYYKKVLSNILSYREPHKRESNGHSLPYKQYSSIIHKSDKLMSGRKLFLNSNLTLTDLAKEVGTNRTYLSISIKTTKNQSFSEYINCKRIEYSKTLIKKKIGNCKIGVDNSGMTTEDYAIASGFSTSRNFVRCFKKKEGITPTQYKNALLWKVRK